MIKGRCLCGGVSFEVIKGAKGFSVCHCGQCRKQSGHVWASGYAPAADIIITGEVRWFEATPTAKRGFCPTCGSSLFWKAHAEDTMSFALGALENPTGLTLEKHIFVADKGDYYEIADGLPQKP